MRDDVALANLGRAPVEYSYVFFWDAFRAIEQFQTRLLAEGPIRVSFLTVTDIDASGTISGAVKLPLYTVATAPSAVSAGAGMMIYVSNETGGAVPAFSDGTNWRRFTDRAVIS